MTRTSLAIALVTLVFLACDTNTQDDALYPACNGNSPNGLATESTSAGACPTHPAILTGTATVGSPCSDSSDCKPYCCTCSSGASALVAQCENGSCLDGNDTCCLYAQACSN